MEQFGSEKASLDRLRKAAEDELVELLRERHNIDEKILKVQGHLAHLSALSGQPGLSPLSELGLTDAIRFVIATAGIPLGFIEIRDALKQGSFDVTQYTNILASIHTVVSRLLKYGEIKKVHALPTGEILFSWEQGTVPIQMLNKARFVGRIR